MKTRQRHPPCNPAPGPGSTGQLAVIQLRGRSPQLLAPTACCCRGPQLRLRGRGHPVIQLRARARARGVARARRFYRRGVAHALSPFFSPPHAGGEKKGDRASTAQGRETDIFRSLRRSYVLPWWRFPFDPPGESWRKNYVLPWWRFPFDPPGNRHQLGRKLEEI